MSLAEPFTTQRTVLLPRAHASALDYLVPETIAEGTLVETTLMGKKIVGMATNEFNAEVPATKLKPITQMLEYRYSSEFQSWLEFVAEYTLADKGAVLALTCPNYAVKPPRTPYAPKHYHPHLPELSAAQAQAAHELQSATLPSVLDGVTGSGKTEVYFHAIREALAADPNAQVLVLLPEIALTHQWLLRFTEAFGATPDSWHSGQSEAEKKRLWRGVITGEARVVVGARSALFLPFKKLSLIIVDEEHDAAYKQEEGVLYHARDMAVARGKYESARVILATATPSLETVANVAQGRYQQVHLPNRHAGATLPEVALIDMRSEATERGAFLSEALKAAMRETLARGEQVLLFLNRRGYAPLLLCRSCGYRFQCPDCSAWMVQHKGAGSRFQVPAQSPVSEPRNPKPDSHLQCHHCGHHEPMPNACPSCGATHEQLVACGPGVERIAQEVQGYFPEIAPLLLASDATPSAEDFGRAISGEARILIGTQMVAKGHHFPNLTLVGVVDADLGLNGGDLRVSERSYQLLHQLAGRAGREAKQGRVLLQTYQPEHPVMQALQAHGRDAFMQVETDMRKRGNWPPYGQLAAILLDGPNDAAVQQAARQLAASAPVDSRLRVLGPAPAPLSKLKGQYRFRLLIKAEKGVSLQKTLREWLAGMQFKGVRVKLDINPYDFM
jgi:primosomal protein N' (replication factor Y)